MDTTISYGIVGDGRIAKHFKFYFQNMGHDVFTWSRKEKADPSKKLQNADFILILIKDSAIESFISNLTLSHKTFIHFSGSLTTNLAFGFHPLMAFTGELYKANFYPQIPFVVDDDAPEFKKVFPTLKNPHFVINKQLKALYHALCVLAGNGSTLLWQKLFFIFESQLSLPRKIAFLYLQQIMENLQIQAEGALTGPLARNDTITIERNLHALKESPLKDVYRALAKVVKEEKK